ncbi:MAG: diguanylate cyclase and metal dependent phosphohydrolase, partial [Acidobacteria bacterium]|nr:diguanylate cyclase and metal dependent phosphohydrolase [Acidobacteriota bacterium]
KTRVMDAEKHLKEQEQLYLQTVESLALAVDAKDQTTYGHIRRVRVYAMELAKLCGIRNKNEVNAIQTGSLLHDIGKIAIDDYILNKPGRLSKKEYEKMKQHAAAGDEILQQVNFPYPVAKYVRYHHERWDGTGYPDGLKGEEIPLGARILSIADAFDAIRFSRPYKASIETAEAKEILRKQAGTAYDPKLVHLFIDHIDELEQRAIKESENATQLSFRKYAEAVDEDAHSVASSTAAMIRDIPAELVQLAELFNSVSGYLRLEDILAVLAQRLPAIVSFTTFAFYRKDGDDRMLAMYVSGKHSELLKGHAIELGKGISGWAAAYRRPMINASPALDFQGISGDFSLFSDALVVPIVDGDEAMGTISLYAEGPIVYGQSHLNAVQTLAGLLAPLIADARKDRTPDSQNIVDAVTGINRLSFLTAIGPQLISMAAESRTPISLIYLEIRNLPQIIRVLGSSMGDSILKRVADCIKPELRETDILVRYGQQGFTALLPGVRDDQALRCVQRLKQQIRNESVTPGQGFTIDCRAGVAFCPKDGITVLSLLQSAHENLRSASEEKSAPESKVVDFHRA